jgi:hypothetical protein
VQQRIQIGVNKDKHISSSIVSDLGLSTIPIETGRTKHGWQNKGELKEMTLLTNWQEMDLNIH